MMKMDKIWMNGTMVDEANANIHVLSHALHYGSAFFEGIRAYDCGDKGTAVFRLDEHLQRLVESAKIYRTEIPYTVSELRAATIETMKINKFKSAYIRPLVYRGKGKLGLEPRSCPVDVMIAAWEWGTYLGEEALQKGISAQVSSWRRLAPNTMPALAKASGNYLSSQLIKMEALDNGYDEGIGLDYSGNVSEGSGENLFVIKNNVIYTPPLASSALFGITRDTIMEIAKTLNYTVEERVIPREFLYLADEIFLTGTAAEVTPVSFVDKIKIGSGVRGPMTAKLQEQYFSIVSDQTQLNSEWLTYV